MESYLIAKENDTGKMVGGGVCEKVKREVLSSSPGRPDTCSPWWTRVHGCRGIWAQVMGKRTGPSPPVFSENLL